MNIYKRRVFYSHINNGMTALTKQELSDKPKYHKKLLEKAKSATANVELTESVNGKKKVSLKGGSLNYKIGNVERSVSWDTMTVNTFPNHLGNNTKGHTIVLKDGTSFALGKLHKSDDFKFDDDTVDEEGKTEKDYDHKFNRGGVSEGIYACAIFLRFTAKGHNRGNPISEKTLRDFILGRQVDTKVKQTIPGEGENLDVNFKDKIILRLGLKLADIKSLKDGRLWEHWKGKAVKIPGYKEIKATKHDIIKAALVYVNASPGSPNDGAVKGPAYFARLMYANKVYNEVRILAEGEEGQDETKVDIRVDASNHDGEDVKDILRISLKYGGVGQFGQMAGVTWEITANVMRTWFDHEPKFTEKEYNAEIINRDSKQDAARAMVKMWHNEIADITKQLKTKAGAEAFQKALYNNISQGKAAKEEEAGVELIDTYKNDVVVYNLDKIMEQCFYGMELEGELFLSKARGKDQEDLCGLRISALGIAGREREDLIQIRIKRGDSTKKGPYYRTIFEKQHGLTKMLSATVREYDKNWSTSGKRPVI